LSSRPKRTGFLPIFSDDGEGNRTKRTEISTGKVTEYDWDYRNRLTAVAFKDAAGVVTKSIEYTYDVDNQRIGKKVDGAVTERYVIDRNQISLVFDGAGTQTHLYLYGTAVDQVLADETPTSMVWALADRLGTVSDLVDNSGNVVNHITYDSFGRLVSESAPTFDFRYGYTGREQDDETGLEYYRARYYDSAVGRFISEDPIGFEAGDTNIYRYVGNNAVNAIDPSGLYSRNLQVLLASTIPDNSPKVRQYKIISANYATALTNTTTWFYLITVDYAREQKSIQSPKIEWLLTAPLRNTSSSRHGGKANLRPGGSSGRYPTIDLAEMKKEVNGKEIITRHETPKYEHIKEIKFKYEGDPDDKTKCPVLFPNPEPKLPDILPKRDRQPLPSPPEPLQPIPNGTEPQGDNWWDIPFGVIRFLFGAEERH
jgi:RHS repeat-associated protein